MKKIQEYKLYIGLVGLIIVFLMYHFLNQDSQEMSIQQLMQEQTTMEVVERVETTVEKISSVIYVDVKGQVQNPAMYQMNRGDRVNDVIIKAGGFTHEAADYYVNLAQVLEDQMVIYVPNINDTLDSSELNSIVSSPSNFANIDTDHRVNINTADSQELMTLPSIGPKKAQAIIEHRENQGSFQAIEDIMLVSGIGEKTFQQFQDLIKVD